MRYGDIYWIDLPGRGGREQRGRRPAVIWQDMTAFAHLPTVLVVPLTSRISALRFSATVRLEPVPANGLSLPSVALVFQLGACDVARIVERLGSLSEDEVEAIAKLARRLQKLA